MTFMLIFKTQVVTWSNNYTKHDIKYHHGNFSNDTSYEHVNKYCHG